ncbi:MAG: cytochrome-c oxidase, cbb3-type subunit III [Pseudomonadota bacterium]
MSADKDDKKSAEGFGTTGHSWDGIEEWNNPLPRWWLWTFYATIAWGLLYTILYPAWPLVSQATGGLLGYSTRAEVAEDIAAAEAANADLRAELAEIDLTMIAENPEVHQFAISAGAAVFRTNCSQCHGSGAAGVQASGYPNLLDDAWLWGGQIEEIAYTVTHGIRNEQSFDSRWSQMPAYGEFLEEPDIDALVAHVLTISGRTEMADAGLLEAGAQLYAEQCTGCHMEDGTGDPTQGAPNLTDAIWLYGGDPETLKETITYARFGIMPAWGEEYRPGGGGLSPSDINAVAAYVHQLGGGQ